MKDQFVSTMPFLNCRTNKNNKQTPLSHEIFGKRITGQLIDERVNQTLLIWFNPIFWEKSD